MIPCNMPATCLVGGFEPRASRWKAPNGESRLNLSVRYSTATPYYLVIALSATKAIFEQVSRFLAG